MLSTLAPETPVLTNHARERCAEMGISTKVAKRIFQNPTLTYPDYEGSDRRVIISDRHPEYLVVAEDEPTRTCIVTVAFNTPGVTYDRQGETYIVAEHRIGAGR